MSAASDWFHHFLNFLTKPSAVSCGWVNWGADVAPALVRYSLVVLNQAVLVVLSHVDIFIAGLLGTVIIGLGTNALSKMMGI